MDGIDIVKTLATLGFASREDVSKAIEQALKEREANSTPKTQISISEAIHAALKPFMDALDAANSSVEIRASPTEPTRDNRAQPAPLPVKKRGYEPEL